MLMSAAGNTAPTAEPSMGTPNQTTGTTTAARATNSPQNSLMMMAAAASAPWLSRRLMCQIRLLGR